MTLVTAHPLDRRLAEALPAKRCMPWAAGCAMSSVRASIPTIPPPKDLDYVVTGLSLEALVARLRSGRTGERGRRVLRRR